MTQGTATKQREVSDANKLELNKDCNFIIALDISASMQNKDTPAAGQTRYQYALEMCEQFAHEASKYDPDGVSIYTFGAKVHAHQDVKEDQINKLLENQSFEGATMTHSAIQAAWDEHKKKGNKQTCLMIFTDGEPSDEAAMLKTVADITNKMATNEEFTMIIITVGQRSDSLEAFLTKLDDDLPGAKYDIVDVEAMEDVGDFTNAFVGAMTK